MSCSPFAKSRNHTHININDVENESRRKLLKAAESQSAQPRAYNVGLSKLVAHHGELEKLFDISKLTDQNLGNILNSYMATKCFHRVN